MKLSSMLKSKNYVKLDIQIIQKNNGKMEI